MLNDIGIPKAHQFLITLKHSFGTSYLLFFAWNVLTNFVKPQAFL